MNIALRIILKQPTPGVDFGLQKGRGSNYETVQTQRSSGRDLKFEFAVAVKSDQDGAPDFAGPFVQGARGGRFVYLDIGTYAGQSGSCWSRRLKVPLSCITRELLKERTTLVGEIPGTGKDGGPSSGYGWMKGLDLWRWQPTGKRKNALR